VGERPLSNGARTAFSPTAGRAGRILKRLLSGRAGNGVHERVVQRMSLGLLPVCRIRLAEVQALASMRIEDLQIVGQGSCYGIVSWRHLGCIEIVRGSWRERKEMAQRAVCDPAVSAKHLGKTVSTRIPTHTAASDSTGAKTAVPDSRRSTAMVETPAESLAYSGKDQ